MNKLFLNAILGLAFSISIPVYANPDNSCDGEQSIFEAYTLKGGKHVAVCYVYGDVRYVYGNDSGKPEMLINVPIEKVKFSMAGNGDQSVTIPNKKYQYIVGEYLRGGPFIQVWKGQSFVTEIKLNASDFENHIERYINN
ncbi:hypothetical protein [uncultured Serratia sp.]|uniref:hypothetical protein n=1 Tax=uncultured Serratia sp. TaxID=239175 RepID=UPI00258754C5|nr:hypothetical protein [uncultured Serratia sp.]